MNGQNMALYAAASKHFVKCAGSKTLHSVPDLNSADRFKPLCLVKRKTSFWIWKKPKIIPTMLTLNDVLEKPIEATKMLDTATVIEAYKDTPSFNVDGDIGAKIASELDIDLSMTDKFSLSVDFGDITKTEVKWEPLEKALASVRINPDHALFREVAKSKRTSLCIVLETVACKGDSPLSEDSDMKESGKASGKIPKVSAVSVDVHVSGDAEQKSHHSYTIPAGTVIAFSCTNLDIDEKGVMRMHVGVDKVDNIDAEENIPSSLKSEFEIKVKEDLKPLLSSKRFPDIKKAFAEVLKTPSCLDHLLEMISLASFNVSEKKSVSFPFESVRSDMDGAEGWKNLLELLGFKIPATISAESEVEFPTEDAEGLIRAFWPLAEAASDISEKDAASFEKCTSEYADDLLQTLSNAIKKKDTPYSDVSKLMETESNEKKFLLGLGFQVMEGADGKCLSYRWKTHSPLRDAFTLVFALLSD